MLKIKILYIFTSCKSTGPTQQLLNLINNLDYDTFSPYLITIYEENGNSLLLEYKKKIEHKLIPITKCDIILGNTKKIKKMIEIIQPDIIHTSGVFPDYMICRMGIKNHVLTSRNYIYDDYMVEYGKTFGYFLAKLHLYTIKSTAYAQVCSESLQRIYRDKEKLFLPYIRNGVDIKKFTVANNTEKKQLRVKLELPLEKKIVIYGAVFNERKNQEFLLKSVAGKIELKNVCFLLLGDGPDYSKLKTQYSNYSNIIMPGNTNIMTDYLKASDYYVSTSKSEGLPNGVLEAMASGLPVILSDIEQHKEILCANDKIGYVYEAGNEEDFRMKLRELLSSDYETLKQQSLESILNNFSAQGMSINYQKLYKKIVCGE